MLHRKTKQVRGVRVPGGELLWVGWPEKAFLRRIHFSKRKCRNEPEDISGRRIQGKGEASAKALRQGCVWHV